MGEFKKYIKKAVQVQAQQMPTEFDVETPEGKMHGNAGDYLVCGVEGEMYPVKRSVFLKTYTEVQ